MLPFASLSRPTTPPEATRRAPVLTTPTIAGLRHNTRKRYDPSHSFRPSSLLQQLDALLAGKDWSPSPPPPNLNSTSPSASSLSPAATQALRKSRAQNTRLASTRSESPSSSSPHLGSSSSPSPGLDQKTQNEAYFAGLGKLNASRSADLPPSQGGRYQGFGNTPTPPPSSSHPSFGLSSANAPTLQDSPMAALSKGWSIFSSAVAGASKVVNDTVIQPGKEKISDPSFQSNIKGYVNEAGKRAAGVGSSANQWSRSQFGIDVADTVYGVKERVLGGPARSGYGQVSSRAENESSALYDAGDDDDLFGEYSQGKTYDPAPDNFNHTNSTGESTAAAAAGNNGATGEPTASVTSRAKPAKKENEWDEWKDF